MSILQKVGHVLKDVGEGAAVVGLAALDVAGEAAVDGQANDPVIVEHPEGPPCEHSDPGPHK